MSIISFHICIFFFQCGWTLCKNYFRFPFLFIYIRILHFNIISFCVFPFQSNLILIQLLCPELCHKNHIICPHLIPSLIAIDGCWRLPNNFWSGHISWLITFKMVLFLGYYKLFRIFCFYLRFFNSSFLIYFLTLVVLVDYFLCSLLILNIIEFVLDYVHSLKYKKCST